MEKKTEKIGKVSARRTVLLYALALARFFFKA
jgi:hypothetical protein